MQKTACFELYDHAAENLCFVQTICARDIVHPETTATVVGKGDIVTLQTLQALADMGATEISIYQHDMHGREKFIVDANDPGTIYADF
jgi:ornithine cyclodeaminase/alanine dehydrogenase-like protein (mu-crystallin family)